MSHRGGYYEPEHKRQGCLDVCRLRSSVDDLKNVNFYKALVGEFIATIVFNIASCSIYDASTSVMAGAFGNGIAVATNIWIFAAISGANFNPAVTLGLLFVRRISLIRALLYIPIQCVGAICGAGIAKAVDFGQVGPGIIKPADKAGVFTTDWQAVGLEVFGTMVFLMTICAAIDEKRPDNTGSKPLQIGLAITIGAFAIGLRSGGCMNPARALGPCVWNSNYDKLWIYWVGPCVGGILGALLYELFLSPQATPSRCLGCCVKGNYDPDTTKKHIEPVTIREYESER